MTKASLDMTKKSKAARLRQLIAQGSVMLPGVPNAGMARQVERAGFDAVYVSGAGMANATAGVPDIGLLSMASSSGPANILPPAQMQFFQRHCKAPRSFAILRRKLIFRCSRT